MKSSKKKIQTQNPPAQSHSSNSRQKKAKGNAHLPIKELESILRRVTDGVIVLDARMNVIYVNPRGAAMLERKSKDLIGKNFWQECPGAEGTSLLSACERALKTQKYIALEYYYPRRERWFENRIYPSRDELSIFFTDITERKQVEEEYTASQRRFQALIENAPDGIALLGIDGKLRQVTPSSTHILGYSPKDVEGMDPADITHPDDLPGLLVLLSDLIQNPGKVTRTEYRFRHNDGSWRWLDSTISNLSMEPSVGAIVFNYRDITDRKQAEQSLRRSQETYKTLFENIPHPMWVYDTETLAFLMVNDAAVEHYGYSREEFRNMTIKDIRPQEAPPSLFDNLAKNHSELEKSAGWKHRKKDGILIDVEITSHALQLEDKAARLVLVNDVTKRRKAEEYIRYQANLLEHVSDAIIGTDMNSTITSWNPAAEAIYGLQAEQVIGRTIRDVLKTEYNNNMTREQVVQQFLEEGVWQGEVIQERKDGTRITILSSVSLVRDHAGVPIAMVAIDRDMTARKQVEDQLRQTENLLRTVLNSVPITIFATDETGVFTLSEGKGLESMGLKPGQLVGHPALEMYSFVRIMQEGGQQTSGQEVIDRALAGETLTVFVQMQGADFETHIGPVRDTTGQITGMVGIALDISERRQAEQALKESEQRLQLLTESIPDMIWSASPDGVSDYYNESFLKYLGKTLDEMHGWAWVNTLHPEDREKSIAAWTEAIKKGKNYEAEFRIRRAADGEYRWHLGRATPLRDPTGKILRWYGTCTDIDEKKRAETKLRDASERLQSLSRRQLQLQESERRAIARELHDQIGQMLTALRVTLEMSTQLPPDQAVRKSEQAKGIVDELLTRVSSLSLQLRPPILDDLGLLPALAWHVHQYEEQTGTAVDLKHRGLKGKRFDSQLETTTYRIVQEALTNSARHARATHIEIDIRVSIELLSLSIRDNGDGFDPTAPPRHTQSSGLSGMRERASLVGGTFQIESKPGQGTRLSIELPLESTSI